jgi:hypothetical protein
VTAKADHWYAAKEIDMGKIQPATTLREAVDLLKQAKAVKQEAQRFYEKHAWSTASRSDKDARGLRKKAKAIGDKAKALHEKARITQDVKDVKNMGAIRALAKEAEVPAKTACDIAKAAMEKIMEKI